MATGVQGFSSYDSSKVPDASRMRFGIVVADWNSEITYSMRDAAYRTLTRHGAKSGNISIIHVPGSFELTFGARMMADTSNFDAIICIGCVVQGETRHFDYICQSVTLGITKLNLSFDIPFVFGVLTTNNMDQAKERAGGKYGNKGDEAAITAIKMIAFKIELED